MLKPGPGQGEVTLKEALTVKVMGFAESAFVLPQAMKTCLNFVPKAPHLHLCLGPGENTEEKDAIPLYGVQVVFWSR